MWGEERLGEIPFAAGLGGFGARPALPPVSLRQPFIRNGRLGQAWPGTPTPTAAGNSGLKCYRCGNQGVRSMLPSMAAMVPGGCVEVDPSQCGTVSSPTGGGVSPGSSNPPSVSTGLATPSWMDGPTTIIVSAKEPNELKPYTDGADVVIRRYSIRDFDQRTGAPNFTEIASGKTDSSGRFSWSGNAPTPNADYKYRVSISPGIGQPKLIDVPARSAADAAAANGQRTTHEVVVPVCPPNVDPIICAVADARLDLLTSNRQQTVIEPPGPYMQLKHPRLMAHWTFFKWWVSDEGVPPKDWPAVVDNFDQAWTIFTSIPFPQWPGIEDLFQRCAAGIAIGQGKDTTRYNVVSSARLYSKTWSDYFPRSDKQIEKDMAAAYLIGLQPIFACMKSKIEAKIRDVKKTMRNMALISYAIVLVNLPMILGLGVGGFGLLATETYDFVTMIQSGKTGLGTGVTAALAAATLAAGNPDLVTAALGPIINGLMNDMDPTMATAVKAIYPQVVRVGVDAIAGIAGNSAASGSANVVSGASSFLDLTGVASVIMVMAIKALASIPKMAAADAAKHLNSALQGAQLAAHDMLAFVSGEEVSPEFKDFLQWVVKAMGLEDLINQAVDDFLSQFQQALDAGEQQGGGVAVVPEADGGGVAVVPTDPAGTPTDVNGTPLPGGVAPITPPSGGSTIPGVPSPPMPSTTSLGTVGSVAGIGGAALALLLVTGALS